MKHIKDSVLEKLPSRIKEYMLEWKNKNMDDFLTQHPNGRLRDLTARQIHKLFCYATIKDSAIISQNIEK